MGMSGSMARRGSSDWHPTRASTTVTETKSLRIVHTDECAPLDVSTTNMNHGA